MTLERTLETLASDGGSRADVAAVIDGIAQAAVSVRDIIADGAMGAALTAQRGTQNSDGDTQYELDVRADELFMAALRDAPVGLYASEELDQPVRLRPDGPLAVAIDPLDGSSNITTNVSIGTIFSVLPVLDGADPLASFLQPGAAQLAAGFFIYGPQLSLVLTWGEGTYIFVYSPRQETFVLSQRDVQIPRKAGEFAINASNLRHWEEPTRLYIADCLQGNEGPREKDYNMRWIAAVVVECYRILQRGGVYLYPADTRPGYGRGRLRMVYETSPIAMLVEQAGGQATDGARRLLDLVPDTLHARTPFVFGSADEVARIGRYHSDPSAIGERAPLFGSRSLFRA
ncbi:fructose-bisphosphatase class I [Sphingobium sp. LB126]|uniref:class 1 fructose-bisphosphatase n=1 Tax=Sphingobium sp. LB126 TaxID=1983755 RepID=UPI000C20147F|nr:class 1 fructose-bisphosphatase [Sphingobium sp. LB126]PJG47093.1 fructose-bisphosphatase class I [Sphingobium sp. LB126]